MFQRTAPSMWPASYAFGLTSMSSTITPGSRRCVRSQPVSTSTSSRSIRTGTAGRGWVMVIVHLLMDQLLHLDPAEQVLPRDRFQEGGMVAPHVRLDRRDHVVVAVSA